MHGGMRRVSAHDLARVEKSLGWLGELARVATMSVDV